MPQNKLKQKVEALTRVIQQMLKDLQQLDVLSRGTLTAFQLHIGEEEWNKVLKQLQEKEQESQTEEKKLELDVE